MPKLVIILARVQVHVEVMLGTETRGVAFLESIVAVFALHSVTVPTHRLLIALFNGRSQYLDKWLA